MRILRGILFLTGTLGFLVFIIWVMFTGAAELDRQAAAERARRDALGCLYYYDKPLAKVPAYCLSYFKNL
jgi:hypothetical protein